MVDSLVSVGRFALAFSRHSVLVLECAVLAAILIFRAGRGLGIPLLFWHERSRKQFFNGVFVALLLGELLFVSYLLDGEQLDWDIQRYFSAGARCFLALTSLLLALRGVLGWLTTSSRAPGSVSSHESAKPFGVAPAIRVEATARRRSIKIQRWPLLLGIATGGTCVGSVVLHPAWLTSVAARLAALPLVREAVGAAPSHVLATLFFLTFFALYLAAAVSRTIRRIAVTPAIGICTLFALVAGVNGFFAFRSDNPSAVLLVLLALLYFGGLPRYKIKIPALAHSYPRAARVDHYPVEPDSKALLRLEEVQIFPPGDTQKQPLVLVCASGGGIRAAVWTTAVLSELELQLNGFSSRTRVIAGASGGMVGASAWVCSLPTPPIDGTVSVLPRERAELDTLIRATAKDCLSEPAKRLVFGDLPLAFFPYNSHDRGQILEETWCENIGPSFRATFGDLRSGERRGFRPSLVFSPMLVEDGRRLLISNLDLEFLTTNEGARCLGGNQGSPCGAASVQQLSRSAYQLARLFPSEWPGFPVSTAARLSASFPYITPSPLLPTEPRRRVVDAGYYDNYGVNVIAGLLSECFYRKEKRQWLLSRYSGVVVIEIRDGVSELSRAGNKIGSDRAPFAIARGLEGLTTPPTAILSARGSVPLFRNDEQLESLSDLFRLDPAFGEGFFATALFEFDGEASLSWYLAKEEIDTLASHAQCGEFYPELHRHMEGLKCWWKCKEPEAQLRSAASSPAAG